MLRRLLYLALDHEAAVLRERNRELEEMVVAANKNTGELVREQNALIRRLREENALSDNARDSKAFHWAEAARRLAREIGATVTDAMPPGAVVDAFMEKYHSRNGIALRFTTWLRNQIAIETELERGRDPDRVVGRRDTLQVVLDTLEDMIAGRS